MAVIGDQSRPNVKTGLQKPHFLQQGLDSDCKSTNYRLEARHPLPLFRNSCPLWSRLLRVLKTCYPPPLMSNPYRLSRVAFWNSLLLICCASGLLSPVFAVDHLEEIRQRGVLRWGADAEGGAPYVYPNPQKPEQLIGFECDLAEALAAKLGVKAEMVQNQ